MRITPCLLALATVLAACSSSTGGGPTGHDLAPDFMLTPGNYWIYEVYRLDSAGARVGDLLGLDSTWVDVLATHDGHATYHLVSYFPDEDPTTASEDRDTTHVRVQAGSVLGILPDVAGNRATGHGGSDRWITLGSSSETWSDAPGRYTESNTVMTPEGEPMEITTNYDYNASGSRSSVREATPATGDVAAMRYSSTLIYRMSFDPPTATFEDGNTHRDITFHAHHYRAAGVGLIRSVEYRESAVGVPGAGFERVLVRYRAE